MPHFIIHTIDSTHHAHDDGADYSDLDQAANTAIVTAGHIAFAELSAGQPSAIVEARIEEADGTVVKRLAVAIAVAPLQLNG